MRNYYSYYNYSWFYPPGFADMASKAYRSMADYVISGLNIAQNNFDAYIDMSKTYSGLIAYDVNEMFKIAVDSSKVFKPAFPAPILTRGTETTTPITIANVENEDDESSLYEWRKLRDEMTEIVCKSGLSDGSR
jgi:hypothetical protein